MRPAGGYHGDMHPIAAGTGPVRLPLLLTTSAEEATAWIATEIASTIRAAAAVGRRCVLILPTGGTPRAVYARLVAEHRAGRLSFRGVTTFNLDEYHGLPPHHPESYHAFMQRELFAHIDIDPQSVNIPCGDLPAEAVAAQAAAYESRIEALGGADLCLLGIGRNGHIAFNEPGSSADSRTRLIALDRTTRVDAAKSFGGLAGVPLRGVSMGIGSIRAARRILLVALGEAKAPALAAAVEGPATTTCPASLLQDHPDVTVIADPAAAGRLDAVRRPWLVGAVAWDQPMVLRAVTDLSQRAATPVLCLTERQYEEHGLTELVATRGDVEAINRDAFRALQAVITGWPGGKPPHLRRPGDIPRPDDDIHPKRVLVLSPHPDDDVISMGGTLARLADQGHEVHVAYGVSGHGGVLDDDARRHLAFVAGLTGSEPAADPRRVKGLIRRTEAVAACAVCGVPEARLHFLDLPFYDRPGRAIATEDVDAMAGLLRDLRPHQVYAAGDLSDPHGTHRTVLSVLEQAWKLVAAEPWAASCRRWLYRGAWAGWEPHEVRMAVPLSPSDVERKRQAILRHQSQKDRVAVPGDDAREFWQRAAERNRAAAETFVRLGLPAYAALETFAPMTGDSL